MRVFLILAAGTLVTAIAAGLAFAVLAASLIKGLSASGDAQLAANVSSAIRDANTGSGSGVVVTADLRRNLAAAGGQSSAVAGSADGAKVALFTADRAPAADGQTAWYVEVHEVGTGRVVCVTATQPEPTEGDPSGSVYPHTMTACER
jgi:hypothetical protein